MAKPLLEVSDLSVDYLTDTADVHAVREVSFTVEPEEFLGIVGESGSGKSTLLFALGQLLSPPGEVVGGSVSFHGHDMIRLAGEELRALRWRDYSVVMQSAMNALNPMKSIGAQFKDTLEAHGTESDEEVQERSAEVLEMVGIDPVHLGSYPHQLSGGMRQRAMIAMALLFTPELVMMDEPTSALDVVAQRSLMSEVKELQEKLGFAVIFVTHDMSLVRRYSDRVIVMYAGQVAESAPTEEIFEHPRHPYTRGLMRSVPTVGGPRKELVGIPGSPPDLAHLPSGCPFHPRCPDVMPSCLTVEPELYRVGEADVRCLLYTEQAKEAV
ncbi:MAG TPA: ABC transporter ATP-binding protein [Myxococcaceae bacterium]|nr:ABC transporter ATP-binding protein [Myxococcaceae bacterium]